MAKHSVPLSDVRFVFQCKQPKCNGRVVLGKKPLLPLRCPECGTVLISNLDNLPVSPIPEGYDFAVLAEKIATARDTADNSRFRFLLEVSIEDGR